MLFWGKNQCLYKKINTFFCNLTAKVLKFIVIIYLVLNLMLHYSTYIYLVVLTINLDKTFSFFCLKIGQFHIQVYFEKCMYCYNIGILRKWRTFKWKQHYHVL